MSSSNHSLTLALDWSMWLMTCPSHFTIRKETCYPLNMLEPSLPQHSTTTHYNNTVPQRTTTKHCHNALPQHSTTTHYHKTLPQCTTTTQYHNVLPQNTTTTHYHNHHHCNAITCSVGCYKIWINLVGLSSIMFYEQIQVTVYCLMMCKCNISDTVL